MIIDVEIPDKVWVLAKKWHQIQKDNPLPKQRETREWNEAFDKHQLLWKEFLAKNKLWVTEKPIKILGIKVPQGRMKHKREFDMAISILRYLEER